MIIVKFIQLIYTFKKIIKIQNLSTTFLQSNYTDKYLYFIFRLIIHYCNMGIIIITNSIYLYQLPIEDMISIVYNHIYISPIF